MKTLLKTKRPGKEKTLLKRINFELDTILYSSNRHLITINKNNDHQAVKTKDNQYKIKIENNIENSIKSFCINVIGILSE